MNKTPFGVTLQASRTALVRFPVPPEAVRFEAGANMLSYGAITRGEILIPRGQKALRISFDGTLFGASRIGHVPFITADTWLDPRLVCETIDGWVGSDATGQPQQLSLSITDLDAGSQLGEDVYVESFGWVFAGGDGDVAYRLALVKALPLAPATANGKGALRRTAGAQVAAYATRDGDTLFLAAARAYRGDTSRWLALRAANPSLRNLAGGIPAADDPLPSGRLLAVPA